jgi:hypothetical protein
MTRTISSLLASTCSEGAAMPKVKTHFEQVPLEQIKSLVDEQLLKTATEKQPGEITGKNRTEVSEATK